MSTNNYEMHVYILLIYNDSLATQYKWMTYRGKWIYRGILLFSIFFIQWLCKTQIDKYALITLIDHQPIIEKLNDKIPKINIINHWS